MKHCRNCLHRDVCGNQGTVRADECKHYIFEEKVWCNNCSHVYRKVDIPFKGIVQYCPNCGLMIGTMVGEVKKCGCGAIMPEDFDLCPNCVSNEVDEK